MFVHRTSSKLLPNLSKRLPTSSAKPPVSLGKHSGIQFEIWIADLHNNGLSYGKLIFLVPHYLGPRIIKAVWRNVMQTREKWVPEYGPQLKASEYENVYLETVGLKSTLLPCSLQFKLVTLRRMYAIVFTLPKERLPED